MRELKTPLLLRAVGFKGFLVKCVFGVDRRRVSAYSIALRAALQKNTTADELAAFLEDNGGVEQLRLGGKKALSATERADIVKQAVINNSIGTFKFDALLTGADADWIDKQVVIVATYLPTGEFVANAVIKHESAVTAALAAHQSLLNAKARAEVKAENEAKKAAEKAEKAAADVEAAVLAAKEKAKKDARQQAKSAAEQEAAARHAQNMTHANTLFDGVLA
jgi:type IV secretory pathway VirB10-like protein